MDITEIYFFLRRKKLAPNDDVRGKFGEVAAHTLNMISFRFLKVVITHALAAMDVMCGKLSLIFRYCSCHSPTHYLKTEISDLSCVW